MPYNPVLSTVLPFLAALGGLLFLLLRRARADFSLQSALPQPAGALRFALQAPGTGPSLLRARSSSGTPFPPPARGELILVVDDDASLRDLLNTVLLNHGYQVALARDGVEGLKLFSAQPDRVALVLTDLHMPNSTGQSFVDLLRPIRPGVPILLMSGLDGSEGGTESVTVRSKDPFLLKPFKPAALLETIHRLLHPAKRSKSPTRPPMPPNPAPRKG